MEINKTLLLNNIGNEPKINATINFLNMNDKEYYQITYKYGCNTTPTRESEKLKYISEELIIKNSLTEKMIKYLFLNDQELSKLTGTTTPSNYKKNILLSLSNFLD